MNPAAHPAPSADPSPESKSRRRVLVVFAVLFNAVGAFLAGVPLVGYLLAPLLRPKKDEWIELGPVADFTVGSTRLMTYRNPHKTPWDGEADKAALYVRRLDGAKFQLLAINCAHLGCPVAWFQESGLFLCPCHGGVYYADGQRASGPPPRGLYEYQYKVESDRLFVLAGRLPTLQESV